jgi:crotonobetainyl-CoA:carnitine CoA-transferase CaiB-like acyl-CoA transferase
MALLAGVLVVDLSRYLPGPLVSRILGDLGARVIKVEEPRLGDPSRHAPEGMRDGQNALATLLLSGHESIALDLKKEAARLCLEELLGSADVLLESFRPGTLARLGLAPTELRRRYPRLVVCSVTGWGQSGPHAHRAGHDLGYQAVAGTLAASSGMPAVPVADVVGAWSAATATIAALYARSASGRGAWVDQSLLDAAGHAALTSWSAEADRPRGVGEPLMLTGSLPCYDLYRTADGGYLALSALEPRFWQRFCKVVERPDLRLRQFSSDPAVHREVAGVVAGRTRAEWTELMNEHDLPAEVVLSLSEALAHPQVGERGMLRSGPEELPRLGFPALVDGVRPRSDDAFPRLGEHTERIVEEFDLARDVARRRRRAAGIGRRRSVKGWLLGLAGRFVTRHRAT